MYSVKRSDRPAVTSLRATFRHPSRGGTGPTGRAASPKLAHCKTDRGPQRQSGEASRSLTATTLLPSSIGNEDVTLRAASSGGRNRVYLYSRQLYFPPVCQQQQCPSSAVAGAEGPVAGAAAR